MFLVTTILQQQQEQFVLAHSFHVEVQGQKTCFENSNGVCWGLTSLVIPCSTEPWTKNDPKCEECDGTQAQRHRLC